MPEANFEPILSNLLSRYPRIAPAPARKPKLLDRLSEALRSRHYSPKPEFRQWLFHVTHVDLFGTKTFSLLGAYDAIKKGPSFLRKRESRESKFETFRNSLATMI